jgi:hypothetical protein
MADATGRVQICVLGQDAAAQSIVFNVGSEGRSYLVLLCCASTELMRLSTLVG